MSKKFLVCLITEEKQENVPMDAAQIAELADLLQGEEWDGKVPFKLSNGNETSQSNILGFMIYGKAIHDSGKIIYFGKD